MTIVLALIGAAVLIGVVIRLTRTRESTAKTITVAQIGAVYSGLSAAPAAPAFAIISFTTPERPHANDALDLQLFKEQGRPGFDWPLSTPRNLEDEERFLEFARSGGFLPRLMETNGIRHHRVDEGDLAQLCTGVITQLYGQPADRAIELIVEGFEWQAS
jgi:hypothetical protein